MKIIYLTNARLPTEKAHGYQICKMCEEFANQGAEVQLWIPERDNDIKDNIQAFYGLKNNFKINKISSFDFYRFWKYLGKLSFWLQGLWFAAKLLFIKADKKSIIYTRDAEISWIFNLRGYRTVYEAHNWPANGRLYKFLIKRARKIVVITHGLESFFLKAGYLKNNIFVAPDGVDLNKFVINLKQTEARARLSLPPDKKIILYTGHLYSWKGADILAQAAKFLEKNFLVVFAGGVETDFEIFKKKHQELIDNKKIAVYKHEPHEMIPVWLKAADVLILPNRAGENISKYFTSPLKLFEYMAAGRPIVASSLPSIKEILNEHNSVLVEADNPESLAGGIRQVLENKILAESLAKRALADVKKYSWSRRAENIMEFICEK